jgi:pantetheine-phosphate adenylyltransferase
MSTTRAGVVVYPGKFDPLTMGHASLVRRALMIFDEVIVSIVRDTSKPPLFTLDERVEMTREVFADEPRVSVVGFSGLLLDHVESCNANAILRGMRAVSDFDTEFQMALMNKRLDERVETIFLLTDFEWLYSNSAIIKELARLGGAVEGLVPDPVARRLRRKYAPALGNHRSHPAIPPACPSTAPAPILGPARRAQAAHAFRLKEAIV